MLTGNDQILSFNYPEQNAYPVFPSPGSSEITTFLHSAKLLIQLYGKIFLARQQRGEIKKNLTEF